jgi:LysR family transcriptional activator of nhaA
MNWLNYHHLLYFWTVAREGSVTAAAAKLRLSQPTLSGQIAKLEEALGEQLFERRGRGLALTEVGRTVFGYADEIFTLGNELVETVARGSAGRSARLDVGVVDGMPKLVAAALLEPAWEDPRGVRLVVREGRLEPLLAQLATHELDVVLSDAPAPTGTAVKVHTHLLAESGVSFFAAPALARRLGESFPACLEDAPLLLPTTDNVLRRSIDTWLDGLGLHPVLVGELQDLALLKAFGQRGRGVFPAATANEEDVIRQYGALVIGRTDEIRERFYAITAERRIKNPAVIAIVEAARASGR